MKVSVYSKENKEIENMELPGELFEARLNQTLIHQAIVAERANQRSPWAHTKSRGEVSGGGRKPWRQKHTGRARVGSTRSPIWVKGGVALGPRSERSYEQKINKKMKRAALFSLLSKKFKDGDVKIVDSLEFSKPKTKEAFTILKNVLPHPKATSLVILKSRNETGFRAMRNIPRRESTTAFGVSVYDIAKNRNLLFEKAAILELVSHYKRS